MHDDQRSSADDVFVVVLGIAALICMALYALVVYVIIPLMICAAVVGVIALIIAGMVCYVRSHAWLPGGFIMLLLNSLALALAVYAAMLAGGAIDHRGAVLSASVTIVLLLFTIVLLTLVRPVVKRRDAEAERAQLLLSQQQELLEAERKARHEAEGIEHPATWKQQQQDFKPAEMWRSAEPIPRGVQVAVQIEGSYGYSVTNDYNTRYFADAHYSWTLGTNPGNYKRHGLLYFDANPTPVTPFFEERQSHRYRFLYIGTGMHMGVFLRRDPVFSSYSYNAFTDDPLTLTIAPLSPEDHEFFRAEEEAEQKRREEEHRREQEAAAAKQQREAREREERRRREAEAAEAKRQREAEELAAQRRERFRMIQVRYGDALFAWRTDDEQLLRYAREHRYELLEAKRTKEIIRDYNTFNDEDPDFGEWLRINHLDLFHRVDEVFFYRARAVAESLPKDYTPPKPPRPKLSPEDRRAKFERYRERALERDRIQAEDRMAAVRQKLDLLRQFRDDLDQYDLDEDERDRLVKEFEADLLTSTEEHANGTYKKL